MLLELFDLDVALVKDYGPEGREFAESGDQVLFLHEEGVVRDVELVKALEHRYELERGQ